MSKGLRIATEELQTVYFPSLFSWHPFYADMSGNNTPCHTEFMKLMECINEKQNSTECFAAYLRLMRCLNNQGFKIPPTN